MVDSDTISCKNKLSSIRNTLAHSPMDETLSKCRNYSSAGVLSSPQSGGKQDSVAKQNNMANGRRQEYKDFPCFSQLKKCFSQSRPKPALRSLHCLSNPDLPKQMSGIDISSADHSRANWVAWYPPSRKPTKPPFTTQTRISVNPPKLPFRTHTRNSVLSLI